MFSVVFGASLLIVMSNSTTGGFQVLENGDADLSAFCVGSVLGKPHFSWDLMEREAVVRLGGKVRHLQIPESWGDREELVKDENGHTFAQATFVMGSYDDTSWASDGGAVRL